VGDVFALIGSKPSLAIIKIARGSEPTIGSASCGFAAG
jgi:hypothetical protein